MYACEAGPNWPRKGGQKWCGGLECTNRTVWIGIAPSTWIVAQPAQRLCNVCTGTMACVRGQFHCKNAGKTGVVADLAAGAEMIGQCRRSFRHGPPLATLRGRGGADTVFKDAFIDKLLPKSL